MIVMELLIALFGLSFYAVRGMYRSLCKFGDEYDRQHYTRSPWMEEVGEFKDFKQTLFAYSTIKGSLGENAIKQIMEEIGDELREIFGDNYMDILREYNYFSEYRPGRTHYCFSTIEVLYDLFLSTKGKIYFSAMNGYSIGTGDYCEQSHKIYRRIEHNLKEHGYDLRFYLDSDKKGDVNNNNAGGHLDLIMPHKATPYYDIKK